MGLSDFLRWGKGARVANKFYVCNIQAHWVFQWTQNKSDQIPELPSQTLLHPGFSTIGFIHPELHGVTFFVLHPPAGFFLWQLWKIHFDDSLDILE